MKDERDLGKQDPAEGDPLEIDDDTDAEDEIQEGENENTGGAE